MPATTITGTPATGCGSPNRWIAANKAGTVEIGKKILPDESTEALAKAYDLVDPRIWGVNGDFTESSYKFTVELMKKVGSLENPVPYDKFFDRRFVDRAVKELDPEKRMEIYGKMQLDAMERSPFVFLLQSAGIEEQNAPRRFIRVTQPIEVREVLSAPDPEL